MWNFAFLFLTALFAVGFGQVPGGLTDVDVNDKGAKIALSHAMDEYNRGSGDDYLYKVVEVIKVQGQVGHIWIINPAEKCDLIKSPKLKTLFYLFSSQEINLSLIF